VTRFAVVCILCRRLFTGATLAYLIASGWLGGSHAARPVFYVLTAGWFAVLCWRQTGIRGQQHSWALRSVELVGFNIALTLFLAEFSLRTFAVLTGNSILAGRPLDAYRLAPGRDYGAGLHGNSLGYPGAEFRRAKRPGIFRIAALGDSFAVGAAVPFADNYLTLLETIQPGIEVYNFGVSGAGPREYHAILRTQALNFQPDLVLVSLFVGNDITESLPTPRGLDPQRHCLYQLLDRGLRLLKERWRRGPAEQGSVSDRLTAGTLAPETFREVEARRLAVCFDPVPPAMEKKWQRALGHLDGLVSDCRRRQVPVACVLIPDEFQVHTEVLTDALAAAHRDRAALDLDKPQRRLLAFFAERGVPCLDLLPAFQRVPNTYQPRDTHWNAGGNRLAADRIGSWLSTGRFCDSPRP